MLPTITLWRTFNSRLEGCVDAAIQALIIIDDDVNFLASRIALVCPFAVSSNARSICQAENSGLDRVLDDYQ